MQHVVYRPPILSVPQVGEEFKIDEEGYVRADSNNKVDIYATIENKSSETVYVTLTIGGNGTVEKTKMCLLLLVVVPEYQPLLMLLKNVSL